jgi:hypothetical protein
VCASTIGPEFDHQYAKKKKKKSKKEKKGLSVSQFHQPL